MPSPRHRFILRLCIWGFVLLLGAFLAYQVFWPEYQRRRLLEEGLPAAATILAADPTGSTYNSQPEVRFRLRIEPQPGTAYEAETEMVINPIYAPRFQPGQRVQVRYDRRDRSRVTIEGPAERALP